MWSSIQLVSVLGSLLVLVAYVASQFGYLSAKGLAYAYANIVGSAILAVVAALEAQWGFLLSEGACGLRGSQPWRRSYGRCRNTERTLPTKIFPTARMNWGSSC